MSSEVCPFCGKAFKRLKSHLPHCKAAAASDKKPPPHHEEAKVSSVLSSSEQHKSKPTVTREKPAQKSSEEREKSEKVLTSTKKKKLKLSEQIKMAAEASVSSPPSTLASKSQTKKQEFNQISHKTKETASETLNVTKDAKLTKKKQVKTVYPNKTSSIEAKVNVKSLKSNLRESFWLEDEDKHRNLQEKDSWTSRREAKITLQDVRTTLGRAKQNGRQNFIVEKSNTEDLKSESSKKNQVSLVTAVQSLSVVAPKSEKSELMLQKSEDFMSELSKIQNRDCAFTRRANSLSEGLRMDHHTMGLGSLSTPARVFLEAGTPSAVLVPVLKPNTERNKSVLEKRSMDVRKQTTADLKNNGVRTQQPLGQVTLRELPYWLFSRTPSRPRDVLELAQRGWQWYHRRYIDVKRGGVGGVAMILAGYCVLSYIWSYPHLKRDRWRKYH